MTQIAITGNETLALAMKQINPDVVAAYPITPQTEIVQLFSQFIADGEVETEFITVESEHSAMSAAVGASSAGVRAMTATSANGLALMLEVVYIAASSRLPIVMPVINRALSGPINIHCDHSDAMAVSNSGCIQIFGENAQQAYDNLLQAVKIAENEEVRLPVMVNMDGFIISHAVENVEILTPEEVNTFIGEYNPDWSLLKSDKPGTLGPLDLQDYYFEHKRQQVEAMEKARQVVKEVGEEYGHLSGRRYGYFDHYQLEDAGIALIGMGSTMGTARVAVDNMRERGIKAGLLNLRLFRPLPTETLRKTLAGVPVIGVLDRADSFSLGGGQLFTDLRSILFNTDPEIRIVNYIYGLGGRDITVSEIEGILFELEKMRERRQEDYSGEDMTVRYQGVRE
ncbi:MAG: pyruvate ferredoxin oxidoreductase [Bacillota bacterium]